MPKLNPKQITWTDPRDRVDGTPFGAADFKAFELGTGPSETGPFTGVLSLPVGFGVGVSPIPDQVAATKGVQFVSLRTVDVQGLTSDWAVPGVDIEFLAVPRAPAVLSVA